MLPAFTLRPPAYSNVCKCCLLLLGLVHHLPACATFRWVLYILLLRHCILFKPFATQTIRGFNCWRINTAGAISQQYNR
ncbi:hypothetical protein MRX96_022826 [Rhipicephalus microplus]